MIQMQNKEHELQLKIWNEICKKFSVPNDSKNLKKKDPKRQFKNFAKTWSEPIICKKTVRNDSLQIANDDHWKFDDLHG